MFSANISISLTDCQWNPIRVPTDGARHNVANILATNAASHRRDLTIFSLRTLCCAGYNAWPDRFPRKFCDAFGSLVSDDDDGYIFFRDDNRCHPLQSLPG